MFGTDITASARTKAIPVITPAARTITSPTPGMFTVPAERRHV